MNACDLSRDVAVVTGALGNLGQLWIETLLEAGARVVAVDLPETKLPDRVALFLDRHGPERFLVTRADVTARDSLVEVRETCAARRWMVSVLVNNAGIDQPPAVLPQTYRVEDVPSDLFRGVLDVNVLGAFHGMQVFGPGMVEAGRGSIVNIGSVYASVAPDPRLYEHLPGEPPFLKPPAYGASKAALVNLTRYFAALWGPHRVRVNTLSPGGVRAAQDDDFVAKYSARVPMRRMALRDDLVGPLLFLASDASRYVTGIDLRVDGGFTIW
jgi:NAD(P)-dependent dehydrogenase (short-subunit alcohol dehydrogenase family)